MEKLTEFYKRYLELCASCNKATSTVAVEIGLSKAAATGWKNGKIPFDTTLTKIASYFDVSVDYLLGKTDTKKEPATPPGDKLSLEIAEKLLALSPENRRIALAQLEVLLAHQEDPEA